MGRISKAVTVLLCCVLAFSFTGCATIFKPKTTEIQINSVPQEASVYFDGNRVGKTPLSVVVSDINPLTVSLKKEGYEDISKRINTRTAMWYYVADILCWPTIIVDAITGNAHTLIDKKLNFTLEPKTVSTNKQ